MRKQKSILFLVLIGLSAYSCKQVAAPTSDGWDKEKVIVETRSMLNSYFRDIAAEGLTSEFRYLDSTADFFWVPPGYQSALTYDSVKTVLIANSPNFKSIDYSWKNLQIVPISLTSASYTGIVSGTMIDTASNSFDVEMIETGVLIKRADGWKILCGQSRNLSSK